jgi:hypothetical protein
MKFLPALMLSLLVASQSFASEIVVTKCSLKSSTWPVHYVRNEQTGNMDQKAYEIAITQEDPNSFERESHQNGLDLAFPLRISLAENTSIESIIPSTGLTSGNLITTPSKFPKKRTFRLGLTSNEVTGILEVRGDTVASKKFNAQLVTVSKSGVSAIANLSCRNIKN